MLVNLIHHILYCLKVSASRVTIYRATRTKLTCCAKGIWMFSGGRPSVSENLLSRKN